MIQSYSNVVVAVALLAQAGISTGCSRNTFWSDPYSVPIRVKAGGHKPIKGVVARAISKDEYERAIESLGEPLASSPKYLELFEMSTLKPAPLGDDSTVNVAVMRHGVERHTPGPYTPGRGAVHEERQEKAVVGVSYADGSKNAFIFDVPPPGPNAELVAEIPAVQADPGEAADER